MQISWEVRNRFRLFREERDFLLHTESAQDRSILASEQALELQSDGRGWARNTVNRLCIDLAGRVSEPCTRDNVKESYLTPTDHPVTVRLTGAGSGRRHLRLVVRRRRRSAAIDVRLRRADQSAGALRPRHQLPPSMSPADPRRRSASPPRSWCAISSSPASATASPPAKAIRTGRSRWRTKGSASAPIWARASGAILSPEPRRLQRRTGLRSAGISAGVAAPERAVVQFRLPSLALQLPDPHRARARGAISAHRGDLSAAGLHRRHHPRRAVRRRSARANARRRNRRPPARAPSTRNLPNCATPSTAAKRRQPDRKLDLVLLSIGANDINFSGLVADVIVDTADRARAVQAHRRDGIGRRFARGAGARPAAELCQAARGAEAAGRRPVARRLRVLCQPGAVGRRCALPRRPRRLRYSSLVQRRPAAARQRVRLSCRTNSCRS